MMRSFLLSLFLLLSMAAVVQAQQAGKYNVLFLMVDDLRPQLGCYGDTVVQTPNIDRLAARGTVFNRAYCQMAVCSPSRTSLLTGRRPDATKVYDLTTHFRDHLPDAVTLPQLFRQQGWHSAGLYKIFHLIPSDPRAFGNMDDPRSWSEPLWLPARSVYGPKGEAIRQRKLQEMARAGKGMDYSNIPRGFAVEAPQLADSMLADGETAQQAIRMLQKLKDQPFFLAVGFYKPHLPFIAPKKYWDLYDRAALQLPANRFPPENAPPYAVVKYADLRLYEDYKHIKGTDALSEAQQKELLHGYLACISFIDAQVGMILDELDRLHLRENTIVVLLGDHGYQVGEHDMWATKHTNYETSTRAPLIVSMPGQKAAGCTSQALVEFVDIYPTLADICGLQVGKELSGKSFAALLNDPASASWTKKAALSQYTRRRDGVPGMGRTIRTDRYRLVEWRFPATGHVAYELYDHRADPQENRNIATLPGNKAIVETLRKQLHQAWKTKKQ